MSAVRKPISLSKPASPSSVPSEDDQRLFRETVGPVMPMRSDKILPHRPTPRPYPKRHDYAQEWAGSNPADLPLLTTGDIMSYVCSGMHKNVLRRLRRGHYGIDAEIDLHGCTVNEAQNLLERFLRVCFSDGCLCVHIIHGKGYRSEGDCPVLKNKVNLWLRQQPEVLAFCTARPIDGGTGAVYVLLRGRNRWGLTD